VADRTRIELEQFQAPPRLPAEYHSGEITGPGTRVCSKCGRQVAFVTTGEIEPCPECKQHHFPARTNKPVIITSNN